METAFNLTSIGLLYDGVGVAILGYAFFSTPLSAIFINSRNFFGGNNGVLHAGLETRTDGIVGTLLLLIGFILQLFGSINISFYMVGESLCVILFVFFVSYFDFLKKQLIESQIKRIKAFEGQWNKSDE